MAGCQRTPWASIQAGTSRVRSIVSFVSSMSEPGPVTAARSARNSVSE